jgi:transforming growth factor-beta-induced protein
MHITNRRFAVAVTSLAIVAASCGGDDGDTASAAAETTAAPAAEAPAETTAAEPAAATGDVLEVAAAEGDLGSFLASTEAAEIMDGLHGDGPFTLFAPTDEAFAAYLEAAGMTQDQVFADPVMLRRVVEHHIVEANDDAEMVMGMAGQSFTTAAGTPLAVAVEGETVMVGEATVLRYDLQASNGVIHVIDTVLTPPAG